RRLGVFPGGFSLGLASAIATDERLDEWAVIDALGVLVDRSLVTLDGMASPRYRLPQSTREYACLKLDAAGELATLQRRHAQALAALIDDAFEAFWVTPDAAWLATWARELDNLRAALDWATRHEPALALRLCGASGFLFLLLGLAPEGRKRFMALDAAAASADASPELARYWRERSRLHWGISNALMSEHAAKAVALSRTAGDARELYLALRCAAGSAAVPAEAAAAMVAEMAQLERPDWPPRLRAQRLLAEIGVLKAAGKVTEMRGSVQALLALSRQAGLDSTVRAALSTLSALNLSLGDADAALRCAREVTAGGALRRDNFVLQALACTAQALLARGDCIAAHDAVADFLATSRSRDWEWFDLYADLYALLAAREGRVEAAARLLGHADAASRRVGTRELNMLQARAETAAIVEAAFDAAQRERLQAEGARLDPELVCAATLGAE
ncbi:MAG TPA: hypothetical protein VKI18_13350, partial [Albitalea sp.]|nr:hypothetical protein [Albitalea sp.]